MRVQSRDFIETREGLVFAVVADELECGNILCFLRYVKSAKGYKKISTKAANKLLARDYPEYLYHSDVRDANLHAVTEHAVVEYYLSKSAVSAIRAKFNPDKIELKFRFLLNEFERRGLDISVFGVTGSLLLGAQGPNSDIDLVVYGRDVFFLTRKLLQSMIQEGQIQYLDEGLWREAYQKRCCELSFAEYLWHEKRKYNKFSIDGTKVDLSLIAEPNHSQSPAGRKRGNTVIEAVVMDDRYAFDYPAVYPVDHIRIDEVISFTPTYTGQARTGERVMASGMIEEANNGRLRLVVGSSREAPGEYIKVSGGNQ